MLLQRLHECQARDCSSDVRNEFSGESSRSDLFLTNSIIIFYFYTNELQQTKSDRFLWIFSKLWFCRRTNAVEMQNETNHSLETKIADDKNQTTGTTTIDCINDTKFQSIRKVRQLKDASATPAKAMKLQRTQQLDEIIDAISQQANEMKEFLSTTATRDNGNDDARHFLRQQQIFMSDVVIKLRGIATVDAGTTANRFPHASTPYRTAKNKKIVEVSPGSPLRSSSKFD